MHIIGRPTLANVFPLSEEVPEVGCTVAMADVTLAAVVVVSAVVIAAVVAIAVDEE